jgi:ubiquinone/menaquinone biosynthesis C-methylase UbiE
MDKSDIARETRKYYDGRAEEYDRTIGLSEEQQAEADRVDAMLGGLDADRILEVGSGTGRATRFLKGRVVAVDSSERMLDIARRRAPGAMFVQAIVPPLPFADGAFDVVLAAHVFSHLEQDARASFVAEARRVAHSLVVVEILREEGSPTDGTEERELTDGSRFVIRKSYFTAGRLLSELGGGTILFQGRWFVVASVPFEGPPRDTG